MLDFGIAKLRADLPVQSRTPRSGPEPTATDGGRLLGTLGYMSPEQGRPADRPPHRYLLVWVRPLRGHHRKAHFSVRFATLKQIVEHEPDLLSTSARARWPRTYRPYVPGEGPSHRYGSMREIASDLREVRRKMDDTAVVEVPRRGDRRRYLLIAGIAVLLAVGTAGWWQAGRRPTATGSSGRVSIERLTTTGTAIDAAISPDGRHLAWVESAGGMQGLRLRRLDQGQTRARAGSRRRLLGDRVHARRFSAAVCDQERAESCRPSVRGKRPRRAFDAGPRWDRQHSQLFARRKANGVLSGRVPEPGTTSLVTADVDGNSLRVIAIARPPEFFVPAFFCGPWSPDSRRIVAVVHNGSTGMPSL